MRDHISSDWQAAILVCGKCSKKVKGGFGPKGKTRLAEALRECSNGRKGRKADLGVIETGCLKICPKNAVMVVDGNRPKDWLIVEAGTPVGQVAARLGLPRR
jgi:predicted metal-binding protein